MIIGPRDSRDRCFFTKATIAVTGAIRPRAESARAAGSTALGLGPGRPRCCGPSRSARTMPRISCPWRSLYSLKMMSRLGVAHALQEHLLGGSAPRCARRCCAPCFMSSTAPNSLSCWASALRRHAGCQKTPEKPSSSPISASSPCVRATARPDLPLRGRDFLRTTVMYWKRSMLPLSSLKRASSFAGRPETRLAPPSRWPPPSSR